MNDEMVLEELRAAKSGVIEAETHLSALLEDVEAAPRAEKTTISEALRDAFRKLRNAREHLGKLEKLIRDT